MKVLITGGTGLIGQALARHLADGGHQATLTSRGEPHPAGAAAVVGWNCESADELVPHLEAADAVVHLAGENIGAGRWTAARKRRIRDSRVRSTRALVEAVEAASRRPAVVVQGSAVGFYGPRDDEPVTEESGPGDDFLAGVCRDWEAAGAGLEPLGVRRVIVRTGVVLAAEGGVLSRMLLPFRLFAGGPVGSGRQVVPWIHVEDQVRAIAHLLASEDARGPFNLVAPGAVSNRRLASIAGRVLRRPSFVPAPALALRLLLGEMAALVLTGQRAEPSRLLAGGFSFRHPELEGALRDLLGRDAGDGSS